jgi:hypothetical protein
LFQKLKALELALGCCFEVIHVPGTTMITQRTDGLSRDIWASRLNTEFKYFASKVFFAVLATAGLTKCMLEKIQISPELAPFWNV